MIATVYVRFPGPAWEQALIGACLWGGERAVASHRSAAALWGLDGIRKDAIEILLPHSRRSPLAGLQIRVSSVLTQADIAQVGRFPVTSVSRTLIDLGSVVSVSSVEEALESALRRGLTSVARLRWRLDELGTRGRKGAAVLRDLLAERPSSTAAAESALEVRLSRLLHRAQLPAPTRQYEIVADRKVVARCDFAYPSVRLAIEADGYAFHLGKGRWQKDLTRRSRLAELGWRVIHVTDEDLRRRPDEVVGWIRRALGADQATFLL